MAYARSSVTVYLAFDFKDANNGVMVSRSKDKGKTWSNPLARNADAHPAVLDDRESITADPTNFNYVYAVWYRLVFSDATQSVVVEGPGSFDMRKAPIAHGLCIGDCALPVVASSHAALTARRRAIR